MALFTDGPCATINDLTDQDAGLLDAAANANINVTTKLALAHAEVEAELELWLDQSNPFMGLPWVVGPHVNQVVVTAALRQWEIMKALTLIYRDAYFSQLVDRYQAKWNEFARLSREARDSFMLTGIGLVADPVERAATPVMSTQPGSQPGTVVYASIAWVNAASQEGAASEPASITTTDGNVATVVNADAAPANAVGFNVYAGTALNTMVLQNQTAVPAGTVFAYIPGSSVSTQGPGRGQRPEYFRPVTRRILRG